MYGTAKSGPVQATCKGTRSGTHRTVPPAETVARVAVHRSALGITRVANVTGLDRTGVPTVMVCRPNARSTAVFHGKGLDLDAAKASGLMEAAETFHAEHIDLPVKFGSVHDLGRHHPLIEVEGLARVPRSRFHADLPMLWIEGTDLLRDEPVWLPFETVHANDASSPPGHGCFAAGTNGLASGNHRLEAISHGICEVVERDAQSLWNQTDMRGRAGTRVADGTVDDEPCRQVLAGFEAAGLTASIFDITSDVGVAAFYCLLFDPEREEAHVGHGTGCHPAREIALLRALTEAAQVRMTYIIGSREDLAPSDYSTRVLADKWRRARSLLTATPQRDFRTLATRDFETFEDEIAWLLERLRTAGVGQVAGVDLTKAEFGIPVVRVVIPGLEGCDHHDDYAPGARALALRKARR